MEHKFLVDSKGNKLNATLNEGQKVELELNNRRAIMFRKKIWSVCDDLLDRVKEEEDSDSMWSLIVSIEKLQSISYNHNSFYE